MQDECEGIKRLYNELELLNPGDAIMEDGIVDTQKYWSAGIRILWVLKQDYEDAGANEHPYAVRLKCACDNGHIMTTKRNTWSAMSLVSYGLLQNKRDYSLLPDAKSCCEEGLFHTAIIELNKAVGETGSESPDPVIRAGFERYKELVFLQITTYRPHVIIVGLPQALKDIVDRLHKHCHKTAFPDRLPSDRLHNEIIEGADVAIGKDVKPVMLWAYHPSAKRGGNGKPISNESYTNSILNAYYRAIGAAP